MTLKEISPCVGINNPTDKHKASVDFEEENWDETNRVWLIIRSSSSSFICSTQKEAHF